jgi:hypothetical protein
VRLAGIYQLPLAKWSPSEIQLLPLRMSLLRSREARQPPPSDKLPGKILEATTKFENTYFEISNIGFSYKVFVFQIKPSVETCNFWFAPIISCEFQWSTGLEK